MTGKLISFTQQYIKTFNCVQIQLLVLDRNSWNPLIVCKQIIPGSFENRYRQTIRLQIIYVWYIC